MRDTAAAFQALLTGRAAVPQNQTPGAYEGVILTVVNGKATFTIADFDSDQKFDPAPFTRSTSPPKPGDRCLVVFTGNGVDKGWIISWSDASE